MYPPEDCINQFSRRTALAGRCAQLVEIESSLFNQLFQAHEQFVL
jgi:hypothetical protein